MLKNFEKQWATVNKAIYEAYPPTPPITKANPFMKWMLTFAQDHLSGCIGVRVAPLYNVIRDIELVPDATPLQNASDPSQPLMPHSEENGLVKEELAQRASHDDPEFIEENAEVFTMLETANSSLTEPCSSE